MISIFVGAITVVILMYSWYHVKFRNVDKNLPPGLPEWPLVGSLPSIVFTNEDQHELMRKWALRYGPIFTFRLFNTRLFVLSKFELVHEAFMHPDITDRAPLLAAERLMGRPNNGIVHSSGQTWKEQRRFALNVLRNLSVKNGGYDVWIANQARQFLQKLQETKCRPFDARQLVTMCLANVLISVTLGMEFDLEDPDFQTLTRLVHDLFEAAGAGHLLVLVPFMARLPLLTRKFSSAVKKLLDFELNILDQKQRSFNPDVPSKDFVHSYLKQLKVTQDGDRPSTFDEINLKQTCLELLGAGWDTSATAMNWILLYLIAYPDVQNRVQKEIDEVIGRDRPPTIADVESMPFTEATICEIMRIATIVPEGVPHLVRKDTNFHGYVLPKGSLVIGNLWGLSRDQDVWGDPDTFRPERFLRDQIFASRPEVIPFSTGRRTCPGERFARHELLLFTLYTLQSFTLKKATDDTRLDMKGISSLTYCTKPFELRAVPRN